MTDNSALIFDLDGTLIDSVYAHVVAWQRVLDDAQYVVPAWRIHRLIGMSGKLLPPLLVREFFGEELESEQIDLMETKHDQEYEKLGDLVQPLDGAQDLIARLNTSGVDWAIATSSNYGSAQQHLERLGIPQDIPVVSGDLDLKAKPSPDMFVEAAKRLDADPQDCFVVGDSPWDILAARRGGFLGVGVLTGGFSREELDATAPYRVYNGPRDLLMHIEELGVT